MHYGSTEAERGEREKNSLLLNKFFDGTRKFINMWGFESENETCGEMDLENLHFAGDAFHSFPFIFCSLQHQWAFFTHTKRHVDDDDCEGLNGLLME
jgi:hypothetical protein